MGKYSKHTPTQLLKEANEIKSLHEKLKEEVVQDTYELEELEKTINNKINKINELERSYVELIEELDRR